MRALITGINGFAGSHLADYLLTLPQMQVYGGVFGNCENIAHLDGRATFISGDLTDPKFAQSLLKETEPERIYHLAGQAFPPASLQDPWTTLEINVRSQVNVLHYATQLKTPPRILVIGSMEEYGHVREETLPVTENTPFRPDSPYGVSKVTQDLLGLQYFQSHDLPVVRVRPTNHIGPRQSEQFVTSNFAKQIAEIEKDLREPVLYVGNLKAERDFVDVRDMVHAYYLALERGEMGQVYNIGSGQPRAIQAVLDLLLAESRVPIRVEQDPDRLRRSDARKLYYSAVKFSAQTGWQPTISLETSLHDLLEYWRGKLEQVHR